MATFVKGQPWSAQSAAALNDLVKRVEALEAASKPKPARKPKSDTDEG